MKKNRFFNGGKAWALLAAAAITLAFTSCAQDGYDDESWDGGVENAQLENPSVDDITITASADGSKQTISWPVVYGAGGYHAVLTNTTDNVVLVDTIVDGTSFAAPRAEDNTYTIALSVLDNAELNNKGTEPVVKEFSTFASTFATIPAGSDLAQWFKDNPIESGHEGEMLCFDLEAGGEYTLSEALDFLGNQVTLRTTSANHAKISFTSENATFKTYTAISLKNLDIDMSGSKDALITMSDTPDESLKGATGTGDYYNIMYTATLSGCNISGVNGNLVYDDNVKYCLATMLVNNCNVHLTSSSATSVSGNAIIYFKAGFINDLIVQNSTFWNNGDSDQKYFVQYNNSGRSTRAGYTSNSITYANSTFYNVAKSGQWGNYSGFAGQSCSVYTLTNNIFVDCGKKELVRRFLGGRLGSSTATIANNTYMYGGEFESTGGSVAGYDDSGTAIEENPGFANPSEGDFTVSGSAQLSRRTGDPRWLPAE